MTKAYLTSLPRGFIRRQAGFKIEGDFFLKRATVEPPESLKKLLWSQADGWRERFRRHAHTRDTFAMGGMDGFDLAAEGFLNLLVSLRVSFLQDAALVQAQFPAHPMFGHLLFQNVDWQPFATAVQVAEAKEQEPFSLKVQQLVPEMTDSVTNMFRQVQKTLEPILGRIEANTDKTLAYQKDWATGNIGLFAHPTPKASFWTPALAAPPTSQSLPWPMIPFSASSSTELAAQAPLPLTSFPASVTASSATPSLPKMRMNRHISKVDDLWREWTQGYGGCESVESAAARKGLCTDNGECKWRSRRKVIVDEIKKTGTIGVPNGKGDRGGDGT